jgi:hypothetical protein
VEKAVMEMTDTGDDDVYVDVLTLLGEDGLKLMAKLINNIRNWRVAQGFHLRYNDCLQEAKSYKMQQPSHNQPHHTCSKDSSNDS